MREPDKAHQEMKKMLRQGVGPQNVASHDVLVEDCTKVLMIQLRSLRGHPTPLVQR